MLTLKVQLRNIIGRKTESLRKRGLVPAVVYGHGFKSISVEVPYLEFEKVFQQAGESSLINLEIERASPKGASSKPIKVLVHDLQYHPLTDQIQHVDFYKIKAGEKIIVELELKFINESPAVKQLGGVLTYGSDKVEIECLPEDLIHEIEVDISKLKTFNDIIRVKDLKFPQGIKVLKDLEEMIARVERPRIEEVPVEEPEEVKEVVEEKAEGAEEKPTSPPSEPVSPTGGPAKAKEKK
ncbi:50S ribosomal protein L25 [Patescibacteria group bacterium]|nr:50S ribosomal protein L25 [Patescibacteria group bacterium]